jgi:hypothetical protein
MRKLFIKPSELFSSEGMEPYRETFVEAFGQDNAWREHISLEEVLDRCGFDFALRALHAVAGGRRAKLTYAIHCARYILPIFEHYYPTDLRPKNALEALERFLSDRSRTPGMRIPDELFAMRSQMHKIRTSEMAANAVVRTVGHALHISISWKVAHNDAAMAVLLRNIFDDSMRAIGFASGRGQRTAIPVFLPSTLAIVRKEAESAAIAMAVKPRDKKQFIRQLVLQKAESLFAEEFARMCRLQDEYAPLPSSRESQEDMS